MKRNKAESSYFTVSEAARLLNVSRQAVHAAIERGLLEAEMGVVMQPKKVLRVSAKSVREYDVNKHQQERGKKN